MPNVYYEPDKCGLVRVGELDESGLSYEYNTLLVLQCKVSGRLFWCRDSGCSCPVPFEHEHFNGPDDHSLNELHGGTIAALEADVKDFPVTQGERDELLITVRKLLKRI